LQRIQAVLINPDALRHRIIVAGQPHGRHGRGPGEFHYPSSVAVLGARAYVCDSWNHRVQAFTLPDWKFAFEFQDFFCPQWIEVIEHRGEPLLLVVDTNNARLCFHRPDGRRVSVFSFESETFPVAARAAGTGVVEVVFEDEHTERFEIANIVSPADWTTKLDKPISIARDTRGFFYVSDFGRRTVEKYDADGTFVAEILDSSVVTPGKMLMNGDDLLITDRPSNAVFIYNTLDGSCRRWNYTFDSPGYIGKDADGNIWVGPYTMEPNPDGATFPVFSPRYQLQRSVRFRETRQPTCIAFAAGQVLLADQAARNILTFLDDGTFTGTLREEPYNGPVWCVLPDGTGHIYVGAGTVVDLLWAADLNRLYYIDFEMSAVRYSSTLILAASP
jgi:hypothetical protein